jgi:hypothetical protein
MTPPTAHEYHYLLDCVATAEDYGVQLLVHSMQCESVLEAISQAAKLLHADIIFACVPPSRIPYWRAFQGWIMRRQLGTKLVTLDQPVEVWNAPPQTIGGVPLIKNQLSGDNQLPVQ